MSQLAAELAKGLGAWAKEAPREMLVIFVLAFVLGVVWLFGRFQQDNEERRMQRIDRFITTIESKISEQNAVDRERNVLLRELVSTNNRFQQDLMKLADDALLLRRQVDRLESRLDTVMGPAGPPIAPRTLAPVRPGP